MTPRLLYLSSILDRSGHPTCPLTAESHHVGAGGGLIDEYQLPRRRSATRWGVSSGRRTPTGAITRNAGSCSPPRRAPRAELIAGLAREAELLCRAASSSQPE